MGFLPLLHIPAGINMFGSHKVPPELKRIRRKVGEEVRCYRIKYLEAQQVSVTMVTLDFGTLTRPVGIVRILEVILTCISFSLVASVGHSTFSFWTWCMFTWCFCFCVTLLILFLEFTSLSAKLPISWNDFTTAFAMLATLMVLAASIIYPIFFTCSNCVRQIVATVTSCLAFILYATEVGLTRAKTGEISGFLSTVPGLLKVLEAFVACIIFICLNFNQYSRFPGLQCLVATVGYVSSSYWVWCMFTWCFCFFFTFLILILEFTTINTKMPFAWDDFTTALAMLASLMCLAASIIYPTFFTCTNCPRQIGASVVSWVCFAVYVGEVVLTRLRPTGQNSGFLSTLPGIMKMLETFLACLIFTSLESSQYHNFPGLQWCVAVYSLCFTFAVIIILLSLGGLTSVFPFSFDKLVIVYNIMAAVMYVTAMVIWPLYGFRTSRPSPCKAPCSWDKLVVVTFMTILNVIVYGLDTAYSIRL
ncbi:hypothetical protein L3Q82_014282, partial [Scortum barcoo]